MKKFLLSALSLATFMQVSALDYSSESACLSNDYVKEWGKLKLVGNQLSSETGQPVQLRGWSTHGYQWSGKSCYDDKKDFEGMKKFGANVARIAMYITEGGSVNDDWVKSCMDWTAELGMYCLVDWHILTPGLPTNSQYMNMNPGGFFQRMIEYAKQKNYKHVLYEICNEPNEDTEGNIYRPHVWEDIKDYADQILPKIAEKDPNAVVIVGTPQWDQAVVFPMEDPLEDTYGLNVMYTFHYYACSHEVYLGGMQAAAGNIPIFVTEWGTTEHKGQSGLCKEESDLLMNTCNGGNLGNQLISWCNWSFSTEGGESKSLNRADEYTENNLSNSGKYILTQLRKGDVTSLPAQSTPYKGEAQVIKKVGDSYLEVDKYDEGGQDVAFHDFDADWVFDQFGGCQASKGQGKMEKDFREGDCLDVARVDGEDFCNIGFIVEGEWVKFTVDVEEAGYYKVVPLANRHNSYNVIAISVDGQNAVRDLNDRENTKIAAVRLKVYGEPMNDGGYDEWGESKFISKYDGKSESKTDYGIYFPKAGKQVLSIAFMTECAGFSKMKFTNADDHSNVEAVEAEEVASIYPNPSEDGNFTVEAEGEAKVEVYDFSGKLIYNTIVNGGSAVNANLKTGVYAVKVSTNGTTNVSKLVVR